jgi:SAM-dependent methyltransferase
MTSEKVDFDKYAEDYDRKLTEDLEFFGEESGYFAEYKIQIVQNNIEDRPLNILEYGCGIGRNLKYFSKYFPESKITGCDISAKSIGIAKNNNPDLDLFIISEEELVKHSGKFDLIFISCVFHHIEPKLRNDSMNNVYNLLRNNGSLFFFEHNPYNPVTRKIVRECPWDSDAILLKPKESLILIGNSGFNLQTKKYTLFFPAFLKGLRFLENMIWFLPFGGQYYIQASKNK